MSDVKVRSPTSLSSYNVPPSGLKDQVLLTFRSPNYGEVPPPGLFPVDPAQTTLSRNSIFFSISLKNC